MNIEQARIENRRAAWRWGSLVVGMLTVQVVAGAFAIRLATRDPSVAVVPDYYQKALDWDDHVALRRASQKLGWDVLLQQIDLDKPYSGLQIDVVDRSGRPVPLKSGSVRLYSHVRANQ